jgi:transposase
LLPPNNARIADIVKETGVPKDTLYEWRTRYRTKQGASPYSGKSTNQCSADDKMAVIIETATLNEVELNKYCRCKGIYPVQIKSWKASMVQGLMSEPSKTGREKSQKQARTIQDLEKDLSRKEKALAEVVALLVLQKKFQVLMGRNNQTAEPITVLYSTYFQLALYSRRHFSQFSVRLQFFEKKRVILPISQTNPTIPTRKEKGEE